MADPVSYIGCAVGLSVATPASVDSTGFGALSYTTLGKIVSVGPIGDKTADINATTLAGRTFHRNGAADGGEVNFAILYDPAGDAGAQMALAQNNGGNTVSIRIADPDGKFTYAYGVLANFQDGTRDANSMKTYNFVGRINSATVRPSF